MNCSENQQLANHFWELPGNLPWFFYRWKPIQIIQVEEERLIVTEVTLHSQHWKRNDKLFGISKAYETVLDCQMLLPQVIIPHQRLVELNTYLTNWLELPLKELKHNPLRGKFVFAQEFEHHLFIEFDQVEGMESYPDHAMCKLRFQMGGFHGFCQIHIDQTCVVEMFTGLSNFLEETVI